MFWDSLRYVANKQKSARVKKDLNRALDIVMYALTHSYYIDPFTKQKLPVKGGLLSGWAFTSVMGSLMSYAAV